VEASRVTTLRRHIKFKPPFLLLFIVLLLLSFSQIVFIFNEGVVYAQPQFANFDFNQLVNEIRRENIVEHVRFFSNISSRVTGYPGSVLAANYIYEVFSRHGLKSSYDFYDVVVPQSYGANVTVISEGKVFEAHAFEPNLVATCSTPPGGINGTLIYVGYGEPKDFNEKPIEGSVVLMETNSERNWLYAAKLGAKAVIFIAPVYSTTFQYAWKTLNVPYNFPRLYVSYEVGQSLRSIAQKGLVEVNVKSTMKWELKRAINVVGILEGTDHPDQMIVISSYYDSYSFVPSLAPGAQESIGISALLELVRLLSQNRPKYSILFVAFSGHNQALEGSRRFVDEIAFTSKESWEKIGKNILMWINIDLTSENSEICMMGSGGFNGLGYAGADRHQSISRDIQVLINEMNYQLGNRYSYKEMIYQDNWVQVFPRIYPNLDHEPFFSANFAEKGVPGWSFTTTYSSRISWWRTPLDTFERINFDNVWPQFEMIYASIRMLVGTSDLITAYAIHYPWTPSRPSHYTGPAYIQVNGTVATYNYTTGWYTPIPHALVFITSPWASSLSFVNGPFIGTVGLPGSRPSMGIGDWLIAMTDEKGRFSQTGIGARRHSFIYAFLLDEDGEVLYGPDFGKYRFSSDLLRWELGTWDIGYLVVFRCATVILHDAIDPYTRTVPRDYSQNIIVNRLSSHTVADNFGFLYQVDANFGLSVATVFVPTDESVEILVRTSYAQRYPLVPLINCTEKAPSGLGFNLKASERISLTPLDYAKNLYWLNEFRLGKLLGAVSSAQVKEHVDGKLKIDEADKCLSENIYDKYLTLSFDAWAIERNAYLQVRGLIEDAVTTVPFFAVILVLFTYFAEKLFFATEGIKRITALASIFASGVAALWGLHPGFVLASNITMVLIGFVIVVLISPVFFLVFADFGALVKRLALKTFGPVYEVNRVSLFAMSLSSGVEFMKHRKFRTSLVLLSIILVIIALVSFSMLIPISMIQAKIVGTNPSYEGLEFKHHNWGELSVGIGVNIYNWLTTKYANNVTVVSRAWLYYPYVPSSNGYPAKFGNKSLGVTFVGLMPEESDLRGIDTCIMTGRWFTKYDTRVCILSDVAALYLNLTDVPANIDIAGVQFTVIGIFNSQMLASMVDLDQETITPLSLGIPGTWTYHMSTEAIVLAPYKEVISWYGSSFGTYAKFTDTTQLADASIEAARLFRGIEIFSGKENNIGLFTEASTLTLLGWQYQIIPLVIGIMVIFNVMLASVYERSNYIFTFSFLGLPPSQVLFLFLSEALAIALISSIFGYVAAMLVSKLAAQAFAGLLNYSSTWVVISLGIAILAVVASIVYPTFIASKMITPSLERVWRVPTKPSDSEWSIPLPFSTSNETEANGILVFLYDFLQLHSRHRSPLFTVSDLQYDERKENGRWIKQLQMSATLEPYEAGIKEDVRIFISKPPEENRWYINLFILWKGGMKSLWEESNRRLADSLRKRLLVWSGLSPQDRIKYMERNLK
jgi:hypothetical protein